MIATDSPAARAVVVLGDRQGSGVALNRHLVLTCAHVVGATTAPEVAHPRCADRTTAQVVWSDAGLDAALLLTADELPCSGHVRVGHLATEHALPDCEIIGYPDIQRRGGTGLATDQFTGRVLPAAARPRTVLTFSFDRSPPTRAPPRDPAHWRDCPARPSSPATSCSASSARSPAAAAICARRASRCPTCPRCRTTSRNPNRSPGTIRRTAPTSATTPTPSASPSARCESSAWTTSTAARPSGTSAPPI
ncbi:hypothetical protein DN402_15645 [Streptomyces sp. SW4]|nr:hypothetical protein DN402_15645 [Streptomyces sp. SW4]